jgi:hydrogenase nickel incorporation protein HypA/HybF
MHEYILADKVLQSVIAFMDEHDLSKISLVDVDLGELLAMESGSLTMAYQILCKGTKAEGSKLRIHLVKGAVICNKCGYKGKLNNIPQVHSIDPVFACPSCGAPVSIKAGNDIRLNSIS